MINNENYFSKEQRMKYMGASQFKAFLNCESAALAEILGEYEHEKTTALLVGSYVDAHFEGTLDIFKAQNPEIFIKSGALKAEYRQAEYIIQRIERDEMFMKYMAGEKQVIKIGEIEGIPFKTKIDSYHPGKAIVDLKVMRDMAPVWKDGQKMEWWEAWGYAYQGAIYQAVEGNSLPFFIAVATKETETDIKLFQMSQSTLDCAIETVKAKVKRFDDIKKGLVEPERCGRCNCCKFNKVLSEIEEI